MKYILKRNVKRLLNIFYQDIDKTLSLAEVTSMVAEYEELDNITTF